MRIELTSPAWEAGVIPLYDTRLASNPAVRSIGASSCRKQPHHAAVLVFEHMAVVHVRKLAGRRAIHAHPRHCHRKHAGACDFERCGMSDLGCMMVTICAGSGALRAPVTCLLSGAAMRAAYRRRSGVAD